jgi:type I restriction enzyme M protein
LEIRKEMIQAGVVDVMVAVGSNMFYTVTLPVTLWFLDKGKQNLTPRPSLKGREPSPSHTGEGLGVRSKDTILFIDARNIYTQIDRAHREWSENQLGLLATLARLYRGDDLNGTDVAMQRLSKSEFPQLSEDQIAALKSSIKNRKYADIAGLCKLATLKEVEAQGWSLNPGRYVGVTEKNFDNVDFPARLEELNNELEVLNSEADELEQKISDNVKMLLEL